MPQNGGTEAVMEENYDEDGMRRVQWAQRKERMQREKRKQMMIRKVSRVALPAAGVILAVLVGIAVKNGGRKEGVEASAAGQEGNGAAGMENGDGTDAKKRGENQPGVREDGQSQGGQADGEEGSAAGGGEARQEPGKAAREARQALGRAVLLRPQSCPGSIRQPGRRFPRGMMWPAAMQF